ncbi:hypothetical protein NC661_07385 [Aquibacillus koreensis]|uniref:Uncharacterized protein n=1 Tax=Aquibacillus koreensis TaxID=279446 RepID=A0A9X4AHQ1_9BACI|nr:hypothetical protein [Aquibacillus koreensis]MCT2535735.1 hypothetical protein [Aquibacillus koreensis]MDC3420191.1 hypothetical protein [Aquibacillus koreensis]
MNKDQQFPFKKSYESDGVMGKDKKKTEQRKKQNEDEVDETMFFNITESSE